MNYLQRAKSFKTKKRLGQNFLVNPDIISFITEASNMSCQDVVLEIGAGLGFVTEQLVKKAGEVIAVELDDDAISELEKIKTDNLKILHKDI